MAGDDAPVLVAPTIATSGWDLNFEADDWQDDHAAWCVQPELCRFRPALSSAALDLSHLHSWHMTVLLCGLPFGNRLGVTVRQLSRSALLSWVRVLFVTLDKSETYKQTIKGKFHHIIPYGIHIKEECTYPLIFFLIQGIHVSVNVDVNVNVHGCPGLKNKLAYRVFLFYMDTVWYYVVEFSFYCFFVLVRLSCKARSHPRFVPCPSRFVPFHFVSPHSTAFHLVLFVLSSCHYSLPPLPPASTTVWYGSHSLLSVPYGFKLNPVSFCLRSMLR